MIYKTYPLSKTLKIKPQKIPLDILEVLQYNISLLFIPALYETFLGVFGGTGAVR